MGALAQQANNMANNDLQSDWGLVCQQLMAEFGDATYRSWISPISLVGINGGIVQLSVPTQFMRDWITTHYVTKMRGFWQDVNPTVDTVEILVKAVQAPVMVSSLSHPNSSLIMQHPSPFSPSGMNLSSGNSAGTPPATPNLTGIIPPQGTTSYSGSSTVEGEGMNIEGSFIGSTLDNRYTFEDFVVGKPNELAYAAALRVAESKTVQFNPLFLYGGVGLGKTHLMHAIAWHIKKCHPERRVIYLSAEKFMYQFIRALRYKDTVAFKDQFRSVDVLMIDDLQFISGKESTQEEFFHTFNALVDRNHQVIVSADKSPSDLLGMEDRLRSRLGWGLVADIHPTSYELRLGILQAKADVLNTHIPKDVMEFLAYKIASNIRELEGALNRIIAHSTLVGREINLEMTQEVLRDLLKANDRRITIEDIQKRVSEYYSIKVADMQSARRSQNVARPRQVAMFLTKVLTTRSLPDIGRKFGGRDHTTVLHAVRKVEQLMAEDREFAEDLTLLRRTLEF